MSKKMFKIQKCRTCQKITSVNLQKTCDFCKGKEIFYDAHNGESSPMTYCDILAQVKNNPFATDPNALFFFSKDGKTSYSIATIARILNIELEKMD